MDIPQPKQDEYTVYSKSGCPNCNKVKQLLKEKKITFSIVDCDEFLLEDKQVFLQFIQSIAGKEHKTFPMVFDGMTFIGGFSETTVYLEKMLEFDDTF